MAADVHSADAYQILGVPRDADAMTIRRAFKKLAMKHHPDAVPPEEKSEAGRVFSRINQAHEVLIDKEKRAKYDGLLRRGITPDLSQDLGAESQFHSLADIIGEIQSLRIADGAELTPTGMDETLYEKMLKGSLIKGDGFAESIVDVFQFNSLDEHQGFETPSGLFVERWCIVTQLRVMFLMKWVHEYQQGNTKYTNTYFRSRAFPYTSLNNFEFHELGWAFVSYKLALEDEDGTRFLVSLANTSFARLMLVANVYQLPLKINTRANLRGEIAGAFGISAIPILLWVAPFAIYGVFKFIGNLFDSEVRRTPYAFSQILVWMNEHYLTMFAVLALPTIFVPLIVRVFCCWYAGHPGDVVGVLLHDYARGGDGGPSATAPATGNAPALVTGGFGWLSDAVNNAPATEHAPAAGRPRIPTAIPVAAPVGPGPATVAPVNAPPPAPASQPNAASPIAARPVAPVKAGVKSKPEPTRIVACLKCGQKYSVPESRTKPVKCQECGAVTQLSVNGRAPSTSGPAVVAMPESLRFAREQVITATDEDKESPPLPPTVQPPARPTLPPSLAVPSPALAATIVDCPSCGAEYRMSAGTRGTAKCLSCGRRFRVGDGA